MRPAEWNREELEAAYFATMLQNICPNACSTPKRAAQSCAPRFGVEQKKLRFLAGGLFGRGGFQRHAAHQALTWLVAGTALAGHRANVGGRCGWRSGAVGWRAWRGRDCSGGRAVFAATQAAGQQQAGRAERESTPKHELIPFQRLCCCQLYRCPGCWF